MLGSDVVHCYDEEFLNPFTPYRDQHLSSPYNITLAALIKVMRIKDMITNQQSSWLLIKISLSAP